MTKADIAEKIKEQTGMNGKEAFEALETVFGLIKRTLGAGENLKISGFGSFIVKQKKDRKGRNPQTGDTITIAARKVLIFKPGQTLREKINGKSIQ